ncbi:MAG: single-stranded-DNA-specific exonuclease RecJ [Hyphomonas sp.]|uniref:single-stranded-DNA-specific exonuclease RecJ n=1 Tax=Hyphomonas sp. TaxID=87 RepID=UPI001839A4D6|nr:single-stranded-DNA-specific exonuclease RecJ [Hyphomonas sp.]MBA3067237.1 single-stranded-DNA-specific exonuclease RecJ [Hyphomonas sp.]MBU3920688.1 single-stranded-DNA-specific exonuclease RecJ [Alphaproteobacteria bacterium]MBU4061153.1 single-stranded-DNA-specific exonuclease RecJ [Alphaproteobacteria bacterium]MBU4165065.1 single-stranded-DNA-specific exonuclease RecJ [Alphaproteobacteria bacterium]
MTKPAKITPLAPPAAPDLSVGGRRWRLQQADPRRVQALLPAVGGIDLLARLLAVRGVDAAGAPGYLAPTLREFFPDPSSFADMDKAAGIVLDSILDGRQVVVFADYDVDGGTSSAILARYFRGWGRELGLYVPDRLEEGYGPSPEAFRYLKSKGAELVITVDCGAAAVRALDEADEIGLPIVVIDHHLMSGAVPRTAALVNPNRPDCNSGQGHLAAAGVVFVFVAAMNRLARERGIAPPGGLPDILPLLDLCALGTLCDMAPLTGVNRAFVRQGLSMMARDQNAGLRALADVSGIGKIETVYHATFLLGPRLNAGGRVGDPWLAAKLLATDDRTEAIELAERLHGLNDERKALESAILDAATAQAERALAETPGRGILIAAGEGWHPGVIGIVAGRLKDRFHLPSIVIGWGDGLGPVAKGSGRSVKDVNLGAAIAEAARLGIILSGGGHAMAGGLSLDPGQIPAFDAWMLDHMSAFAAERDAALDLEIDALVAPGAATVQLVTGIASLGPFGVGAPEPVFMLQDVSVTGVRRVGTQHLRFTLEDSSGRLDAIAWRAEGTPIGDALRQGGRFSVAGRLKADNWNGRDRVQLETLDVTRL